jgi:hypothetical protein
MVEDRGEVNPYAPPETPLDRAPVTAAYLGGFRSATPLAKAIVAVMTLIVLIRVLEAVNDVVGISVMGRMIAEAPVDQAEIHGLNSRASAGSSGTVILRLVAAVLFCLFMPRANRNARTFGEHHLEFTPGWAAGVFFVPIWSLYKPYRAIKEIWQHSDPEGRHPWEVGVPDLLPWWWGLYLFSGAAAWIFSSAFKGTLPPDRYIIRCWADMAVGALSATAAAAAALVVWRVARRQDERAAAPAASPPAPGLVPAGGAS